MEFERVKVDVHGKVGVLTLNHPEVMNAVSPEMLKGLISAMTYIERPDTRHARARDDRRQAAAFAPAPTCAAARRRTRSRRKNATRARRSRRRIIRSCGACAI